MYKLVTLEEKKIKKYNMVVNWPHRFFNIRVVTGSSDLAHFKVL